MTGFAAGPVPSPSESERFGLSVGRLHVEKGQPSGAAVDLARAAVRAGSYDLVILRSPEPIAAGLIDGAGIIDAGCAVTYEGAVAGTAAHETSGSGRLARITRWSTREAEIVERIFAGYRNHVAANPRLDAGLVPAGYADWSARHVDGRVPGDCYLLEDEGGETLAFAAVAPSDDALVVDLAGVLPAHRGRGVYQRLLDLIEVEAAERGLARVRIATQVETTVAIHAWERRGWVETAREWTVHVMDGRDGRI